MIFVKVPLICLCLVCGLLTDGVADASEARYPGWESWQPPQRERRLGVNLSKVRRWGAEQAFVNVMKTAGPLTPACGDRDACGPEGEQGYEADENGYPVVPIPARKAQKGWDRVRAAPLLHDLGAYRHDRFTVLYDGEGELAYGAGIRRLEAKAGVEKVHFENPNGGYLSIVASNPDNPIRNLRLIADQFVQSYDAQPFDPQFLKVLGPFSVLRFINWMQTNEEPAFEWKDRPRPDMHSWMDSGVPVEVMVRLANTLKADPWFTLPHNATAEYQRNFADYVYRNLHPSLTAYFELSNEVWNTMFAQTAWAQQLGEVGKPGTVAFSVSQNYGYEAAKMCRAVRAVYAEDSEQMKCVAATHTGWPERATWVLDCPGYASEIGAPCHEWGGFDLLAVTTYFGNIISRDEAEEKDGYRHLLTWREEGDDAAREKMFNYLETGKGWYNDDRHDIPAIFQKIDTLTEYAEQRGLGVVAYEGGTHLVAAGKIHSDEDMLEWIASVNRHDRMAALYAQMFEHWARSETRGLICHYSSVSAHGKWGSWGLLENMWDEPTPRYQAVLDYISGR